MHEIKFRVWHNRTMIIKSLNDLLVDVTNNYMFIGSEVMQYTGLKDKNGTEIWEGDIIKADWHWDTPYAIVWPSDYYDIREYGLDTDYDVEVIGNTYEHPELLHKVEV